MGIDQLKFQSVQLGYLKILQLGNTDPNNKIRKIKYEIKPENRSTRPANQLPVHLNRASIPAQCINRGNHRSMIFRPVSHHSSVVFRHNQSVGTTPMIALDLSGTTHLSAGHNVALSQGLPYSSNLGLERAKELSGSACKNSRATLLLHDPSQTSTQAFQLVLIDSDTQDELNATCLAPYNGVIRWLLTEEGFE
ncbi:hypothetical protein F511_42307 [Dorcoceras hygrometricum]|uniref:Uncharacterized protein n=1 Tax=Dorcoceras hygrometricum TaxID=472368 RepID=A0A2Z7C7V0_9LAMI|nr:hypothetical protein F511_42307 [Dorcoceras hygrometricum]